MSKSEGQEWNNGTVEKWSAGPSHSITPSLHHGFPSDFGLRTSDFGLPRRAFTLIELVLVMALLSIIIAVASPTLARFFRGRNLDVEAQRFLALTRYGQSRAIAEGVPMVLWMDQESGQYGLEAEATYSQDDRLALPFAVSADVEMEVDENFLTARSTLPRSTTELAGNLPSIRFTPDGFFNEDSPQHVLFREAREGDSAKLWVGLSRNRLNYEIQTNQPVIWQRQ